MFASAAKLELFCSLARSFVFSILILWVLVRRAIKFERKFCDNRNAPLRRKLCTSYYSKFAESDFQSEWLCDNGVSKEVPKLKHTQTRNSLNRYSENKQEKTNSEKKIGECETNIKTDIILSLSISSRKSTLCR